MSKFNRSLPEEGLKLLEAKPCWWQHLLAYRYDAKGKPQPLLLAIRDGYLNAYLEGQSVLKIGFKKDRNGTWQLNSRVHEKFVYPNAKGQKLLAFDGSKIDGEPYMGKSTFDGWAKKAKEHVHRENSNLDLTEMEGIAIIVGNNPCVIDVEMGLSRIADRFDSAKRKADRIDIVALERGDKAIRIVFYEAKLFRNPELRADNLRPKVLAQLKRYEDWISAPGRVGEIIEAYRHTCRLLIRLNDTREPEDRPVVDPLIKEAAEPSSNLQVDPNPRLIIFRYAAVASDGSQTAHDSQAKGHDGGNKPNDAYWGRHEYALRQPRAKLIMAPDPEGVNLPLATPREGFWLS